MLFIQDIVRFVFLFSTKVMKLEEFKN